MTQTPYNDIIQKTDLSSYIEYNIDKIRRSTFLAEYFKEYTKLDTESIIPSQCESCGGEIKQIDQNTYQCMHCDSQYYVSTRTVKTIGLHIPIKKMVITTSAVITAFVVITLIVYQAYTTILVKDASRFSVAFRDFLLEVYDKPVANINSDDLSQIKYLRIERIKKSYHFTYSFEDYYNYNPEEFESHTNTVVIKKSIEDFSPSNLQYFTGLVRVELYTNSWHNYMLPEHNKLRSIVCRSDVSRYGNSAFFEKINPTTLCEIVLYSEDALDEDRYILDDIKTVQTLTLQRLIYDQPDMFKDFHHLKELHLLYPIIPQEHAYEIIDATLQCPELEKLVIEGKAAWYLSDAEWNSLQKTYGNRIKIERK